MTRGWSRRRKVAATVAAVAAAQGIPGLAWITPLRVRLWPTLAGLGRSGHVALTFDDGPDPAGTPMILDTLERLGWHATFFMLGSQVTRRPRLAAEVMAAGHEVGVHGYEHRYSLVRGPRAAYRDLARAIDEVGDAIGQRPHWYRPPYGVLSAAGLTNAHLLGLRPVLWSAWGKDWRADATPQSIMATLHRGRIDGGTLLLHDSDIDSAPLSWRGTAATLDLLAEEFATRNLQVGRLRDHDIRGRWDAARHGVA